MLHWCEQQWGSVLCFSLHSTGHNTGNNVCLLLLTGGTLSLLSQKTWSVIRMESFPDGRLVCLAQRQGCIQPWSQTINSWWLSLCPWVWGAPGAHTQVSPWGLSQDSNPGEGNACSGWCFTEIRNAGCLQIGRVATCSTERKKTIF